MNYLDVRCRTCRWSDLRPVTDHQHRGTGTIYRLWCSLNNAPALVACPGYEREPGSEGDDD